MLSVKGKCEFLCATCVHSDVFFLHRQLYFHQFIVRFQLTSAPLAQSADKQRARAAAHLYAALFYGCVFFLPPPSPPPITGNFGLIVAGIVRRGAAVKHPVGIFTLPKHETQKWKFTVIDIHCMSSKRHSVKYLY